MFVFNGYPISIIGAVGLHALVLAMLVLFQSGSRSDVLELVQPTVIKALTVQENPQLSNERTLERQRLERLDQQRVQREREATRQQAAQEASAKAEQEALAKEVAEQQAQRDRDSLRQRQEDERQQAEREQAQRDSDAQTQREQLAAEQERQRQQDLERQRQQDAQDSRLQAAELAQTEFELVQSATGLIQQVVAENWSRPPSARNGMRVNIQIRMLPTGEVTDATITRSSGDAAFDRAAENAVYRASPFRELQGLPIKVFNENFRVLTLIFEPDDLLN
ncbi:MAG: protein TolA [SAR86 cluster bacterium]|uniref:Protein TolA n=1 Tax=SAR86 cluster bacterium TaxID=2030880 RepID=A0A2A4MUB4_9GAMM|nr:MAG: protein TolA [SAR86 cluster bacterium]